MFKVAVNQFEMKENEMLAGKQQQQQHVSLISPSDRKGRLHRSGPRGVKLSDPACEGDPGQEAAGPNGEPGL